VVEATGAAVMVAGLLFSELYGLRGKRASDKSA